MSMQRFEGKVAVITGGNSGIGLAAAIAFSGEGAKVAITGRNEKTLSIAAEKIGPGTLAIAAGMPGSTVYGASKAGLVNLAKTLSADLLERQIRVNVVSPGPITTPILDRMGMTADEIKEPRDWITSQVPLKPGRN